MDSIINQASADAMLQVEADLSKSKNMDDARMTAKAAFFNGMSFVADFINDNGVPASEVIRSIRTNAHRNGILPNPKPGHGPNAN